MTNSTHLDASSFQISDILYQIPVEFSAENPLTCGVGLSLKYLIIFCHQEKGSLIENFFLRHQHIYKSVLVCTTQEFSDRKREGKY
jgi:hypothetical protein